MIFEDNHPCADFLKVTLPNEDYAC